MILISFQNVNLLDNVWRFLVFLSTKYNSEKNFSASVILVKWSG